MLEFIGFIALIALIFGVSLADALGGFFKFVIIGIIVCAAIAIIVKLLESKTGSAFVLIVSIGAIALGVKMINDDSVARTRLCDNWPIDLRATCILTEIDEHNESVNKGWGYAIVGGIAGLASFVTLFDDDKNKNTPKTTTHLAA